MGSSPTPAASRAVRHPGGLFRALTTRVARTPAQRYCLLAGAALLLAGLFGAVADANWGSVSDVNGSNLIVFEVNGWHNVVHLASGAVLLAASGPAHEREDDRAALRHHLRRGRGRGLANDTILGAAAGERRRQRPAVAPAAAGILAALVSPRGEALRTTTADSVR